MSRVRSYVITVNNWEQEDISRLKSVVEIKYGLLGEEIGPQNGVKHLQGYLQLFKATTLSAFMKKLVKVGVKCSIAIAKGTFEQNEIYCKKDGKTHEWGTRKTNQGARNEMVDIKNMIFEGKEDIEILDKHPGSFIRYYRGIGKSRNIVRDRDYREERKEDMKDVVLRDWQREAFGELMAQSNRQVLWIIDHKGNSGKTFLGLWLGAMHGAFEVTSGKTADIAFAYNYEDIVVFDFSRQKQEFVNYAVIEDFKNGRMFSPKYESRTIRFKPKKVIVFSNWEPDLTKLSEDRWRTMTLSKKPNVPWEIEIDRGFIWN